MLKRAVQRGGKIKLTFSLPEEDPPGVVSVVGSFNGWKPGQHELVPRRDNTRSVSITLPPGEHRFRYLASGGIWFDDTHADEIDEYGSVVRV